MTQRGFRRGATHADTIGGLAMLGLILLFLVAVGTTVKRESYRHGQIDALEGDVRYVSLEMDGDVFWHEPSKPEKLYPSRKDAVDPEIESLARRIDEVRMALEAAMESKEQERFSTGVRGIINVGFGVSLDDLLACVDSAWVVCQLQNQSLCGLDVSGGCWFDCCPVEASDG